MKYYISVLITACIMISCALADKKVDACGQKNMPAHAEALHGEDEHGEGLVITLTAQQIAESGITVETAGPGKIDIYKSFPTTITLNQDTISHITAKIAGIVTEITVSLGDNVQAGQVVAVIESKELADIKAEYMLAIDTAKLTASVCEREEQLWKDKILSEQDYLKSKSELAQAEIQLRNAQQKLKAIGFSSKYIKSLSQQCDELITRYEIKAPSCGVVIDKQIVLGQFIDEGSNIFIITDTSKVWANINIYPAYIGSIKDGQQVVIDFGDGIEPVNGNISYISPIISEASKTVLARAVIDNTEGNYRPGLFAKANIAVSSIDAAVVVPQEAIVNLDDEKCVFSFDKHGFEPRVVTLGQSNNTLVEITSGLEAGSRYVAKGAFEIKSEIITSTLDPHAGHGH